MGYPEFHAQALLGSLYRAARSFFFHERTGDFWSDEETEQTMKDRLFLALLSAQSYLEKHPDRQLTSDYDPDTGIVTMTFTVGGFHSGGEYKFSLLRDSDNAPESCGIAEKAQDNTGTLGIIHFSLDKLLNK